MIFFDFKLLGGLIMLNTAKNNVKNNNEDFLKDLLYEDEKRFRSTAMITDLATDGNRKKKKGIIVVVPLFECGLNAKLKNVTVVTSLVNTCKTETAVTGTDSNARKYVDELKDLFDHLDGQIGELSKNPSCKYNKEDFDYANSFFKGIKDNIPHQPQDAKTIARGIYESNGEGTETDLPKTLERVNSKNLKVWAFAFDGFKDQDKVQIVDDRDNRNPVKVFFENKIHGHNGSDLRSLIGDTQFRTINDYLIKKLGNKDFSREKRKSSKFEGYGYYLSYFVQSLLELVLVDNQAALSPMQIDLIGENWLKFLSDLKDDSRLSLFDGYKYDKSEVEEHPKKFVDFMLKKLLGPELLKELGIGDNEFAQYALAADGFSDLLTGADHANQIITMAFNNNPGTLTYNDSLITGQGGFVYGPLWSAYKNMNSDAANKLKLLAFQLKHKKIDFDQDVMETVDEYRFGRPQEPEHNDKSNPNKITGVRHRASKYYDTDISPEELMDLVIEIREITEKFNTKFSDYQQKSKNSELQEEDISGLLSLLCDAAEAGITLSDNQDNGQLEFICRNDKIMKKLCDLLAGKSDKNLDREKEKYEMLYKWLINEHNRAIALMDSRFYYFEFIGDARLCTFYDSLNKNQEKAKFILNLNAKHSLLKNKSFVEKINYNVVSDMFSIDSSKANEILKAIVPLLEPDLIKAVELGELKLDKETTENIIFCWYKDLEYEQIGKIDFSELDVRCARLVILHFIADEQDIPENFLKTCPLKILKELTTPQFFSLMCCDTGNILKNRKDYLQGLYIEDLFTYCKNSERLHHLIKKFFDKYTDYLSDEQLLSVRGKVISVSKKLENKLKNLYKESTLNANIGQIMQILGLNDIGEGELFNILASIKQKSEDEFKEVMSYLFKNYRIYYNTVDQILSAIRNDETGVRDSIHKLLLSDVPNWNRKYINYLDLSSLKSSIEQLTNKKFLAYLLDEQVSNIQLGNKNISYKNLKNMINGFGSKISHRQLEKLIEDYNKTALINADGDDAKQCLIKIVLISNIICDEEKLFEKNYGHMFENIDALKVEFGYLVGYTAHIAFSTDDKRNEYIDACKRFNYDNGNNEDINKGTNYAKIKELIDGLNENIKQREDEMQKENADKNKITKVSMEISKKIQQLSGELSLEIKRIKSDIIVPLKEVKALFQTLSQSMGQKEENINVLRKKVKEYKDIIAQIKIKIEALEGLFIKFKQDRISWCDDVKNKFFDVLKQLDCKKVNKTMQHINREFEKLLNHDNSSNLLSPLIVLETEKNVIKKDENPEQPEQVETKKTFKKFFMDNFISVQASGNHFDDNFSTEQKGSLGIVNVIQPGACEKVGNKTKVKPEQYTPVYILHNLPFILENCHVEEKDLDETMHRFNLNNLTLKFEIGEKQSLERFVDSPLLRGDVNNWYFKAVKKLFCDHADNIYAEANLIFEKDGKNQMQPRHTNNIQKQFRFDLEQLTQKTEQKLVERKRDSNGNKIETIDKEIIVDLDPKSIYAKIYKIDVRRFLFFCGDWMCASKAFRSSEKFLSYFREYVKTRIKFGVDKRLKTDDSACDFLIGLTLLSGFVDNGTEITNDIIDEVCLLLSGKDENQRENQKFSCDDMKFVFGCCAKICGNKKLNETSKKIIKYMVKHKQENVTFSMIMSVYNRIDNDDDKVSILELISNAYPDVSLLDILEIAFDSDNGYFRSTSANSLNIAPDFLSKIMQEIKKQLDKNPELIDQRKDLLVNFFRCWKDEDQKDQNGTNDNSFLDWPNKVSSKESLEALIKIFSNLGDKQLKNKVFKAVIKACSENKKLGITLFDALSMFKEYFYYDLENLWRRGKPEFEVDFVDKYVMDVIKNYPKEI